MTFKLLKLAEETSRRIDAHELVLLVRAGVRFIDGIQGERDDQELKEPEQKSTVKAKEKRRRAAA